MTETSPCTFQNFIDDTDEKILSTVGYIQDHVEVSFIWGLELKRKETFSRKKMKTGNEPLKSFLRVILEAKTIKNQF